MVAVAISHVAEQNVGKIRRREADTYETDHGDGPRNSRHSGRYGPRKDPESNGKSRTCYRKGPDFGLGHDAEVLRLAPAKQMVVVEARQHVQKNSYEDSDE